MVWLTPEITPQAVSERGWANWEAVVTDWGLFQGTSVLPNSAAQIDVVTIPVLPLTIPSVAAIAVGPQSTVDRFTVVYNMNLNVDAFDPQNPATASPIIQPCSVGQPITIPLGGPISIHVDNGQEYLHAFSLEFGWRAPRFIADDGAQTATFFNFIASEDTSILGTVPPKMHAVCYLQAPAAGLIQKRYPLRMNFIYSGGAIVAPSYQRGWPIMGRKRVRVTVSNTATPASSAASLRFGIVADGTQTFPSDPSFPFPREYTVATGISVAAATTYSLTLEGAALANAYFLTMWINSIGNTLLIVSIEAYDD